jgi:hypothetical protein
MNPPVLPFKMGMGDAMLGNQKIVNPILSLRLVMQRVI